MLPVINVRAPNLPAGWEESVVQLAAKGTHIPTQYDKPGDPPSIDAFLVLSVDDPFSEPRIHRAFPGGIGDLEVYRQEVVDGIHDHWIDPAAGKWSYTYSQRLTAYPMPDGTKIDQLQHVVDALVAVPYTRRAQAITWQPWNDANDEHPACFVGGTLISTPGGRIPVERLVDGDKVYAIEVGTGRFIEDTVSNSFVRDEESVRINASGFVLEVSKNQLILTERGWKEACSLTTDDLLLLPSQEDTYPNYNNSCRKPDFQQKLRFKNSSGYCDNMYTRVPVSSTESIGTQKVYDFSVSHNDHAIVANGVVSHNCLQRLHFRIIDEKLVMTAHMRSNDAFKAAYMNMYAFTDLQRSVAARISEASEVLVGVGQYIHVVDSFHIYGSYMDELSGFLKSVRERSWEDRTYQTEDVQDIIDETRTMLLEKESA